MKKYGLYIDQETNEFWYGYWKGRKFYWSEWVSLDKDFSYAPLTRDFSSNDTFEEWATSRNRTNFTALDGPLAPEQLRSIPDAFPELLI